VRKNVQNQNLSSVYACLYLVNDILFNSAKVTHAWGYKRQFEQELPEVFAVLNTVYRGSTIGKVSKNQLKVQVM